MADLIDIAIKEIGYKEGSGNVTKYGKWYGMNGAAWCHMFVSWCANQAGISTSIVPKTASTTTGMQFYKNNGRFKTKGNYTPKRNDIIYFKTGASHVGIVEYVSGNTVHTIEGNTSDKVARRSYSLSYKTITGYGVASDYITASKTGSTIGSGTGTDAKKSTNEPADVSVELAYLEKVLADKEPERKTETYTTQTVQPSKLTVDVFIKHNGNNYQVSVKDGLKVVWERQNTPGKCQFTVIYDDIKPVWVGDLVCIKVNNEEFFKGFVFTIKPTNDKCVDVTVYDQLRYLKNKDTYIYSKKTSSQLVDMIAKDFSLKTGTLDDTKLTISRNESESTLFDIIGNSLDETMSGTGKIYTLYDDYGKLMLKEPWKIDVLIDDTAGQNYNYTCSIDNDFYNQVKLVYENSNTGVLEYGISKSSESINRFGILQYYEKVDNPELFKLKGELLLKIYNRVSRTIKFENLLGSTKVRAGCLVSVLLDLYDIKISGYMLVTKVTHTFNHNEHNMAVEVTGGDFN